MKKKLLLPTGYLLVVLFAGTGCGFNNSYYDKMESLSSRIVNGNGAENAFRELVDSASSNDYWTRYYAIVFLGQVALKSQSYRTRAVSAMLGHLSASDQATQRAIIGAIRDVGSEAVDQSVPLLINFVRSREEKDVCWFSAQALAKVQDKEKTILVIRALVAALDYTPPVDYARGAPQLRQYCLNSLLEISHRQPEFVREELSRRTSGNDADFERQVRELLK